MKIINEHIKSNEYKNVYLLYGDEPYLKKQYRDKLKQAIAGDDTMNYSYYEGDKISVKEIKDMGDTLPFFAEHRLIVVENSGFFKSSNDELADYIRNIPDYLIIIFVETEVDKRNKVYKAVNDIGYISEMKQQTPAVLEKWIAGLLKAEGKVITRPAAELILNKTGASMDLIRAELDKIISYCGDRNEVTEKDIEDICTTQTVSRIFDMIAAIASKKQQQALELYYDLLTLKEPPMRILYLIVRQFNGIFQVQEELNHGRSNADIARTMGAAPFIVNKYAAQAKNFTPSQLKEALTDCAQAEECNYDGVFKHHTVIGKQAFIGSNTMLVAPVTIGDEAMTASGSVITDDVPDGALGLGRAKQVNKLGFATKLFAMLRAKKAQKQAQKD